MVDITELLATGLTAEEAFFFDDYLSLKGIKEAKIAQGTHTFEEPQGGKIVAEVMAGT